MSEVGPEADGGGGARAPGSRRVRPGLGELVRASLWLGAVGFGGGLSVLGAIHTVAVVRRRWLTDREFAATATVAQMLPGGAAANALAYTGLRFFGPAGAVAVYAAFIAPGTAVVTALAALYVHFGVVLRLGPFLAGLGAAVVGVVAAITLQLVRTGVSRAWQMAVATGALLFALDGATSPGELVGLGIGAGLVIDLGVKRLRLARFRRRGRPPPPVALPEEGGRPEVGKRPGNGAVPPGRAGLPALAWLSVPASVGALAAMALLFLRVGLGSYGGGFAVVPHLQSAVLSQGWITEREFADAVAIGKLTPGPVLLMATFIGYLMHGLAGALVATAAIFAGPLLLVVTVGGWLARVRSRRPVRAALRGLTPAVVGLMAAATFSLGRSLEGAADLAIAAASFLTLARFKVNPAWVMVLGGAVRLVLYASGRAGL